MQIASHKLQITNYTLPPLCLTRRQQRFFLIAVVIGAGLLLARLPIREAGLMVGGAMFLTLTLIRPIVSVYALIPLIPFSPLFSASIGGIRVGGMELMLALGLTAWLLQLAAATPVIPMPILRRNAGPLFLPFLLFIGGVSLSWLKMLSLGASLVETAKWLEMLALYLLVYTLLPRQQLKWMLLTIILTGLAQASLGIYQFVFKIGPEGFLLFGGRFLRAYGTFAQPNPYAGYLGLTLPLALSLAMWHIFELRLSDATSRTRRLLNAALLTAAFVFILTALFATQSRSAWLGFAAAAGVVFLLYNRTTAAMIAAGVVLATLLLLVGSFNAGLPQIDASYSAVLSRLADATSIFTISNVGTVEVTDANFAIIERLAHWQAAREMWRDNLWLGVGFGNYAAVYPAYAVGRWLDPLGHAHNYLLNIGAETGLIGITAYLIFWILTFRVLWKAVMQNAGFEKAVAVGVAGAMAHLHIQNFFDNLYVQGMYLHIAILFAIISVLNAHEND